MGDLTSLDNNDTDWTWWDGAADYVSVEGDFALYFTWRQYQDDYADNVLELYGDSDDDGENEYWDWYIGCDPQGSDPFGNGDGSAGWGDLLDDDNMTTTITEGETLLGTWDVYIIRVGTRLFVRVWCG